MVMGQTLMGNAVGAGCRLGHSRHLVDHTTSCESSVLLSITAPSISSKSVLNCRLHS